MTCGEGAASATIVVDASGVELERPDWTDPAPDKLDYRVMGRERRAALAEDSLISVNTFRVGFIRSTW